MHVRKSEILRFCFFAPIHTVFLAAVVFFLESKILIFLLVLLQVFFIFCWFFKKKLQIGKIINSFCNNFKGKKILLDMLPFAAVVIDRSGTILRHNLLFQSEFSEKNVARKSVFSFIDSKKINEITGAESVNINYKDKKYIAFAKKLDQIIVLYFLESTHNKNFTSEYLKTKVAVAFVTFDNKDEMLRDNIDSRELQIVAKVEERLQDFAVSGQGFFKKISSNSYLIFLEEMFLRTCIAEKFKILQTIKEIKNDKDVEATVSIGIGRNGKSIKETEYWARKALEMALGRGGDQVVIKTGPSFAFFGGASKGTQSRSKVRARVVARILSNHIKECDKAIIMGHKFSDLDSIGACIGMYNIVAKAHKKEAMILVNEKNSLAGKLINYFKEEKDSMFFCEEDIIENITGETLLIIVDTHNPMYLESKEFYKACNKIVVIDHHRLMENKIKNALVFYHEPNASSTCEMVTELVSYLSGDVLSKKEAEALLSGIMLDTKNFVIKTSERAFEAAAFLKRKNADTAKTKSLFFSSSESYKEKHKIASKAEFFGGFAIATSESLLQDIRAISAQVADELLEIEEVVASFVLYAHKKGVGVCARSFGKINVQVIMERIGGGGHHGSAGALIEDISVEDAKRRLIEEIKKVEVV